MNAINVKSVGNNKVSIKWDSDKWQYIVRGLNANDTEQSLLLIAIYRRFAIT
jgi:hypothetical protein